MNGRYRLTAIAAIVCTLGIAPVAHAEATRTWVSGVGDDANPCSRTAPCKTWAGAISKTAAGGEMNALDPGGYGTLTITKSITVNGTGTLAGTLASGFQGFVINGANIVVKLKNLSINGAGPTLGTIGVRIINAKAVHLNDVEIYNFSNRGVSWENTASGKLFVNRSEIHDTGARGILFQPAAGGGKLTVTDTLIEANGGGILIDGSVGPASALVTRTTIAGNTNSGIVANSGAKLTLESSSVMDNATGIAATTNALVRVSNSSIVENGTGLSAITGASILSRVNNTFADNATQGSFTGTYGAS